MTYRLENNIIKTKDVIFNDKLGGIGTVFFKCMEKFSNKTAQIQSETGQSETYGNLLNKCVSTAIGLKNRGIKKGDLVCVCSDMILDSCVPIIAAYFIGAVTYCLEPTLPVSDSTPIVKLLPPKIIFVSPVAEEFIKQVLQKSEVSTKLVTFGQEFQSFLKANREDINNFKPEYIKDSSDTHCIYFSSGSTGEPKAILLNHYYTFLTAQPISGTWSRNCLHLGNVQNPVILSCSNWHWVSSFYALVLSITIGSCRILCKDFDGKDVWNVLKKYNVTNVFFSPYQCIEFYLNRPENAALPHLKELLTGGSKLSGEYMTKLCDLLKPAVVRAEYGLTELGFVTNFDPSNEDHKKWAIECPESVGCPVDGVAYKILDLTSGQPLGPNQPGELRIKLSNEKGYMNGYYKMDSSECFDENGWFKTEDIASYDKNFCFYIVDRMKARLIYKDWLIYPSTVEKVLLQHPRVKNAVVIGIPHKEDGEHLMGVVMLNDGEESYGGNNNTVIVDEVIEFVDKNVEHYQRLRKGVCIVKDFPLTVSGKVNRLKIKQLVLEGTVLPV